MGSRAPWASPSCFSKLGVATRACVCSRCSTIAAIFSPSTRRQRQRQKQRRRNHPQKNPQKRFNRSLFARGGPSFIFLFVFLLLQKPQRGRELGATSFTRRAAAAAGQSGGVGLVIRPPVYFGAALCLN